MFNETIILSICKGYFLREGDEKGVIYFWGYEVDVEEAVGLLRGQVVNLQ